MSIIVITIFIWIACTNNKEEPNYIPWQKANGNSGGNKYSFLTEIDTN